MKMRVAIVTHEFPPYIFGGIGVFSLTLAEALSRRGLDVLVVAGSADSHSERLRINSVEVLRVPRGSLPPRHLWFQLRNVNLITRELEGCDIIHGQDCASYPLLAHCKRVGLEIPWVITFHTNPLAELQLTATSIHRGNSLTDIGTYVIGFPMWDLTIRRHIKLADRLVAVSASLRRELCDAYAVDESGMSVVHTCVDFDSLQKVWGQPNKDNRVRLFYAGRLYYRKGIAHLLKVILYLVRDLGVSDFHLQIFGRGPLEGSLKRYVARNGLEKSVTFRGFVSRETLLTSLAESDVVCIPSLYEACPVLMIEAMSMAKPVVAFDLPFARELVGTTGSKLLGNGLHGFASVLWDLIDSKEHRVKMGRLLRSNARRFDSGKIASEYHSIYRELI